MTALPWLMCKVSIIIPVYQGGSPFVQCLKSVRNFAATAWEVIVVIDGEDDVSLQLAQRSGYRVLQLHRNAGPAKARNLGAEVATGDILFFMDADVSLAPDTLSRIQAAFQGNVNCDALIGSYDDQPGSQNFLSQYKNLLHHYTHQHGRSQASTFWGACGAIRKSVFMAIGGFDEAYRRPSIEDIELGYRLRRHGYRIVLDKQVQVKHLKRWGIRSLLKADFFYRALPWTRLIWRDRCFVNDLNLDTHSRLSVLSVYALVALLVLSMVWPWLFPLAIGCSLLLIALNAPVYQFFWKKRSFLFALGVIPWHWLYYAYSGIAFLMGTLQYWIQKNHQPSLVCQTPSVEFSIIEFATASYREH